MKLSFIFHHAIFLVLLVFSQNVQPAQSLNVILGDDAADSPLGIIACFFFSDLSICGDTEESVQDLQGAVQNFLGPDNAPGSASQEGERTPLQRIQNGLALATTALGFVEMMQGARGGNRMLRGDAEEAVFEELVGNRKLRGSENDIVV